VPIARKAAVGILSLLSFLSFIGCVVSLSSFVRAVLPFHMSNALTGAGWFALCYGSLRLWAWPLRRLGVELTMNGPRKVG